MTTHRNRAEQIHAALSDLEQIVRHECKVCEQIKVHQGYKRLDSHKAQHDEGFARALLPTRAVLARLDELRKERPNVTSE